MRGCPAHATTPQFHTGGQYKGKTLHARLCGGGAGGTAQDATQYI